MQRKCILNTILLVIFVLSCSVFAQAQVLDQSVLSGLELTQSVSNPKPGQKITITAKSFSVDTNSATIVWYVDGIETKRGVGQKTLDIIAPAQGRNVAIRVVAISPEGLSINKTLNIISKSVDLIVESSGYTPPFFMGKINVVFQNNVKITAIPHISDSTGKEYDPKNLVYKWEKNGSIIEEISGYGKQSAVFAGTTVPRPFSISVTVSTRDSSIQTKETATVSYSDPIIRFYTNDPLYGPLFNKEISGTKSLGKQREVGVLAVPYGFDKPANDIGSLSLSWIIDGSTKSELSYNESIVVRSPEGSFGTSDIGLRIANTKKILQSANNSFSLLFKSQDNVDTNAVSF